MKVGVNAWLTDRSMDPVGIASALEGLGFESLFVPEHTHIPVQRESAYVGEGEMPAYYADSLDPFVALAFAASATSSLLLGTGICLVSQRDPILLAREAASLDRLSGGRLLLGVGAGWNQEEMRNHGTDPATRFDLMAERVTAMRAIWTSEEAEYRGELVSFGPLRQGVSPVAAGGPPVLVALDGPRHRDAVVSYGSDWFPSLRGQRQRAQRRRVGVAEQLRERITELRALAAEAGRRPPTVTVNGVEAKAASLEALALAGVDRVLFVLEPGDELRTLERLRELQPLVERLAP